MYIYNVYIYIIIYILYYIAFINQALYQGVSDATPPRPERKRERVIDTCGRESRHTCKTYWHAM